MSYLYVRQSSQNPKSSKIKDDSEKQWGYSVKKKKGLHLDKVVNNISLSQSCSFYNKIPIPVYLLDKNNGKYLDLNQSALDLLGYEKETILSHTIYDTLEVIDHEKCRQMILEVMKNEHPTRWTLNQKKRNGETIAIEITASSQLMEDITVILCFVKDLSDKRRVEDQLIHLETLQAMERLSAGIIHEINNPLGIIQGHLEVITLDLEKDSPMFKEIQVIRTEVQRIATILRKLLNVYKPEWGSFSAMELPNILKGDIIKIALKQLNKKGIKVHLDIPDDLGMIYVPSEHIQQAFLNIIINAEDALGQNGDFYIRAHQERDHITLEFEDTGCGIQEMHLKRLFDPFFTTKGTKGTGLGLSVTSGIIRSCGGNIQVESRVHQGTKFTITLPVYNPSQAVNQ